VVAVETIVVSFPISEVSLVLKGLIGTIAALHQATIQRNLPPRGSVLFLVVTLVGSGVALCIPPLEYNVILLVNGQTSILTGARIEIVVGTTTPM